MRIAKPCQCATVRGTCVAVWTKFRSCPRSQIWGLGEPQLPEGARRQAGPAVRETGPREPANAHVSREQGPRGPCLTGFTDHLQKGSMARTA